MVSSPSWFQSEPSIFVGDMSTVSPLSFARNEKNNQALQTRENYERLPATRKTHRADVAVPSLDNFPFAYYDPLTVVVDTVPPASGRSSNLYGAAFTEENPTVNGSELGPEAPNSTKWSWGSPSLSQNQRKPGAHVYSSWSLWYIYPYRSCGYSNLPAGQDNRHRKELHEECVISLAVVAVSSGLVHWTSIWTTIQNIALRAHGESRSGAREHVMAAYFPFRMTVLRCRGCRSMLSSSRCVHIMAP